MTVRGRAILSSINCCSFELRFWRNLSVRAGSWSHSVRMRLGSIYIGISSVCRGQFGYGEPGSTCLGTLSRKPDKGTIYRREEREEGPANLKVGKLKIENQFRALSVK